MLKKRNFGSFTRHMYLIIKKIANPEYAIRNGFGEIITRKKIIAKANAFGFNLSKFFNIVF